jgi:hypothetical protein
MMPEASTGVTLFNPWGRDIETDMKAQRTKFDSEIWQRLRSAPRHIRGDPEGMEKFPRKGVKGGTAIRLKRRESIESILHD